MVTAHGVTKKRGILLGREKDQGGIIQLKAKRECMCQVISSRVPVIKTRLSRPQASEARTINPITLSVPHSTPGNEAGQKCLI